MALVYPKVRTDLIYSPDPEREGYWYIKDPIRGEYLSFNEVQIEMMRALDGSRSFEDIHNHLGEELGIEVPIEKIASFTSRLEREYLLDISSYTFEDKKTRKTILKILNKRGLVFRAKPRNEDAPEGQLFTQGMSQLLRGDPSAAAGYFSAVLEINPKNDRAKQVLNAIHEGFLATKVYASGYKLLIPLFKPDKLLRRIDRLIGNFLFSTRGCIAVVLITLSMLYPMVDILSRDTVFTRPVDATDIVAGVVTFFGFFLMFHELMHGLACTHYGGKVKDVGVMLFYYMIPGAFCDTSDVFVFANRKHKAIVFLAGVGLELIPLSGLWWTLYVVDPTLPGWNGLVVLSSIIAFNSYNNLNPLVQLDGYFTLASLVGKMNLRFEAFAYLKRALAERVLGVKAATPEPSKRDRRIYLWYGIGAALYTPAFTFFQFAWFMPWMVEEMGTPGLLLAAVWFLNIVGRKIRKALVKFARFVFKERHSVFTRKRSIVITLATASLIAVLAAPCSFYVDGQMIIEPQEQASARVSEPGLLDKVLVDEGTHVQAGQTLAVLRSTTLERAHNDAVTEVTRARMELQRLEAGTTEQEVAVAVARTNAERVASGVEAQRLADAKRQRKLEVRSSADLVAAHGAATRADGIRRVSEAETAIVKAGSRVEEIEAARAALRQSEAVLAALEQRIARLQIKSPISGIVIGKLVNERIGERLATGVELFKVLDDTRWRARIIPLRGESLSELREGQTVALRAIGSPNDEIVETRVDRILAPQSETESVIIETSTFGKPTWRGGMTGRARIYGPRRSVAYRVLVVPIIRIVDYDLWRMLWG